VEEVSIGGRSHLVKNLSAKLLMPHLGFTPPAIGGSGTVG
jgi:hypothetical protein